MNDQRRKKTSDAVHSLQSVLVRIELLIEAEQSALEGIPENMVQRVERCEDTISNLEDAKASVEEAINQLEEAVNC